MASSTLKDQLIRYILDFSPPKMMVVGDLMLDQYAWGKVERISPEAPIPVVKITKDEFRLGGAASVVSNLKALGVSPVTVGLLGQDEAGERFRRIYTEMGLDPADLELRADVTTVVKTRVLTEQQQLIRMDREADGAVSNEARAWLKSKVIAHLDQVQGIVLSDYAKGALDEELIRFCIEEGKKRGIPVVADPGKGVPIERYQGVTSIKPNRAEAEAAVGHKLTDNPSILAAAKKLQEKIKADFLSLSLDRDGLLYYKNDTEYHFFPTQVQEVFDVTGAGDMVITLLSVMLATGDGPMLALPMANLAAELEINHMGVVPIPWAEILALIETGTPHSKVTSLDFLLRDLAHQKEPISFTNGYFDQLSAGHLGFLLEAGKIEGRLVVAINSDKSIQRSKGSLPVLKEMDRARLLASLDAVHRVLIFEEEDASRLINLLRPKKVIKGAQFKGQRLPEQQAIEAVGAELVYLPVIDFYGRS